MNKSLCILPLLGILGAHSAQAALNITILDYGATVELSAIGTLDLTGLTYAGFSLPVSADQAELQKSDNIQEIIHFKAGSSTDVYTGFTATPDLTFLGIVNFHLANSASGDLSFSIQDELLFIDTLYTSGQSIAFTQSYIEIDEQSANFTKLIDLIEGTYRWGWSTDEVILTVTTVVPEPSTSALLIGAFSAALVGCRRRSRGAKAS